MSPTLFGAIRVVVLLLVAAGGAAAETRTLRVSGLDQAVEIIRDRWGIAHIYAKTEHDLFFAQGYQAASDRLFQFEIWRRQATGTTAEVFGRGEVKRDIGARLHLFRGDLTQELNHYHPRGEAIVTAYVQGVNAYIEETERNPKLLPIEFTLLGIKPGKWTPSVVVSRHQGLLANIGQELDFALAVRAMGVEHVKALSYFQGGDPDLRIDPAIDLSRLSERILELYRAFRGPMRFVPGHVAAAYRADPAEHRAARAARSLEDAAARPEDVGSNNWVVSGALTQSTFPIMANDPHRVQGAPSLRYWIHLVGPGWNVIGAGEPVLPGVSIGHNEHGAWGLTVFGNDSEDLYVYETNPANPNQYRYRGHWEDMRVIKDAIPVKGEPPVAVELKYTRHGPVLHEDREHRTAYALRAAWLEIGSAPYLASLRMNQARTWEEFVEACRYSRIPAENMVWADVHGNIGYQAVGITPLRPNWSGLVPVPGDGRYEWDGYLPIQALPNALNPPRGFFVTANHYLFPNDYPYKEALHYTWADPFRASRIAEFLGSGRMHSVAEMIRLQNDDLSIPARSLVPQLRDLAIADPAVQKARDALLGWNYVLDKDSIPAGIYEAWQRRLLSGARERLVPKEAREVFSGPSMKKLIDLVLAPDGRFGTDPIAGRNALLVRSLELAVADLTKKLGPDMTAWKYGQEHYKHARLRHPLGDVVKPEIRAKLEVGPAPRGGDGFTVSATGSGDNQTSGGSFKIIADTENWDHSVGQNTPGQSGNPDSPHYRDLFELWAAGKYFPVAYSRSKVESVAGETLVLEPASAPTSGERR